jgi:hypothetical protein
MPTMVNIFQKPQKKCQKIAKHFFNPRRAPPVILTSHPVTLAFFMFFHTLRCPWFEPTTSSSRVHSSTTTPHCHMCLELILVPYILYKTEHKLIIWGPKRFQIKKLSTTKFHNFSRSINFISVVSPSEVIYKIWISNLRNSNVVLHYKMISNKKLSTTKFHNFSRSTTLIFIVSPSKVVYKI